MTDLSPLLVADRGQPATTLQIVDKAGFDLWLAGQPEAARVATKAQNFTGEAAQIAILPGERGAWSAVLGVAKAEAPGPWCLAKAAEALPEGSYRLAEGSPGSAALGWLLGQYRFTTYKADKKARGARILLTNAPAQVDEMVAVAEATWLVRDLVNLPAADLGPAELQAAVEAMAERRAARVSVVQGAALADGYPMIAAVGAAAIPARAPRLIELEWGDAGHPRVAIVGKGVCFDSGGLDIKPSSGMRIMKKDMGGAAHALALAELVIRLRLPVRLHLLIPAVENAVSGAAMRPGDVLRSRAGHTVEVGNTDAEGRLVLGDALTRAVEGKPELILDFATLTGAARVALGPDLPATFVNDEPLATDILAAAEASGDPLWRMPLWQPYDEMFASDIADFSNNSESGFAGAVTAALFLRKFVGEGIPWAHLDTYAWRGAGKPGRPKGGEALGLRALWTLLKSRYHPS